jgi:16S rRNA processing protein RimM
MNALITVGRAGAPHGVRGWVRVEVLTDVPGRFSSLADVHVVPEGGQPRIAGIESATETPRGVLLKLKGCDSREDAEKLRGALLKIPEALVPPAAEGEFYYYQLEGLRVETAEGELVGTLDYISRTGSNDVYFVSKPSGEGHSLVPALKRCIFKIDLEKGVMVVDKDWIT